MLHMKPFLSIPDVIVQSSEFSEGTAKKIDSTAGIIVARAFDKSTGFLKQRRRDVLDCGAQSLFEKETLNEEDRKTLPELWPIATACLGNSGIGATPILKKGDKPCQPMNP